MAACPPLLLVAIFFCLCLPTNCINWKKSLPHVPADVGATAPADTAASIRAGGGSPAGAGHGYQETGWIQDFCRKPGNEFFAEVGGARDRGQPCIAVVLQLRRKTTAV